MPRISRQLQFLALLTAMYWFVQPSAVARASGHLCEERCSESTLCGEECYMTELDFINGNPSSCREYGVYDVSGECCGDQICNGQDVTNCESDCGGWCGGSQCPECNPVYQTGCNSNQMCGADGYCYDVPNCTGGVCNVNKTPVCYEDYCYKNSDCCPGSYCWVRYYWQPQGTCVPLMGYPPPWP